MSEPSEQALDVIEGFASRIWHLRYRVKELEKELKTLKAKYAEEYAERNQEK